MANVIDELLIRLGLDSKDFESGQRKAEDSLRKFSTNTEDQTKKVNAQSKSMGDGFNRAKTELIGLSSVLIGSAGMKAFVGSVVQSQTKLAQLSQTLGANSKDLDAWAAAVRSVGGSKDDLYQTAKSIEDIYQQFKATGALSKEQGLAIAKFGLNPNHMQNPSLFLKELNEGMAKFKGTEQDKEYFARALGINTPSFNLLRRSPEVVGKMLEAMRSLSPVTAENAEAAQKLQDRWAVFLQMMDGFGGHIAGNVLPWLDRLSEKALKVGNDLYELDKKTGGVGSTAAGVAGTVAAGAGTAWSVSKILKGLLGSAKDAAPAAAEAATAAAPAAASAAKSSLPAGMKAAPGWMAGTGVTMVREAARFTFKDWFKGILSAVSEVNPLALKFVFDGLFGTSDEDIAILKEAERRKKIGAGRGVAMPSDLTGDEAPKDSQPTLDKAEKRFGLPAGMLDKIWKIESGRGKNMVGPVTKSGERATGHFQFMPDTAAEFGLSRADTFDLGKSSEAAAKFLSKLLAKYGGDVSKTLAAYNWGAGNVDRKGLAGMPMETRKYIDQYARMSTPAPTRQTSNVAVPAASSSTSETNINGPITVVTQATSADAIARDMNAALQKRVAMSSSSNGMTP